MIAYPNFKINIGLYITKKREDGFHNLETIFYPVDNEQDKICANRLESEVIFTINGADFDEDPSKNICVKAFKLLQKQFDLGGIRIELTKNIPSGAGLGGGSSDAAAILKMTNELYELHLSHAELINYATMLGSDVPFFIDNVPAYATGKGEILRPIELDLSGKTISIFKPDFSISTAEAYAHVHPRDRRTPLTELHNLPISEWKDKIENDFEDALFPIYPILSLIKAKYYELGAEFAALSGSGSALFAIGAHPIDLMPFFSGKSL